MRGFDNTKRTVAGYVALKVMSRYLKRRSKRDRTRTKLTFYVALGIVSAGLLLGFVYFWRQQSSAAKEAADEIVESADEALEGALDAGGGQAEIADATGHVGAAGPAGDDVPQALEPTTTT